MSNDASDQWSIKTAWMRANGVIGAQWDCNGQLISCQLGPSPMVPTTIVSEKDPEAEAREIEMLLFGAS